MNAKKHKGILITWKDDRGFGFIKPNNGTKEVFIHISALPRSSRRPRVGDTIIYDLITETNGKVCASNALIEGIEPNLSTKKQKNKNRLFLNSAIAIVAIAVASFLKLEFAPSKTPSPITLIANPECTIKGNISIDSGKKIYHVPGAEDYESTVIDPARGEIWFCTESEAIANGWQKSPN